MTRTVEALVAQVIAYDDLDQYAIPPATYDGVEPGEDLVLVQTEPHSKRIRKLLDNPLVDIPLRVLSMFIYLIPVVRWKWANLFTTGAYKVAIEHGTVDEGDWITVDLEEAVVEETRTRSGVDDREVWLYEGTVRSRGDRL